MYSFLKKQPEEYPEHLEAGTLNGHGIAGLSGSSTGDRADWTAADL